MQLQQLRECEELQGRHVIVRGSINLPLDEEGRVSGSFRLKRLLPTLTYLKEHDARTILMGHMGRGPADTLRPVYEELKTRIPVSWGGAILSAEFREAYEAMADGDILMVENLRQDAREAANDPAFAAAIAAYGDLYVNDAFGNSHRDHASMVGLPRLLPACAGFNLVREVEELAKVTRPQAPSLFMLGGAKFKTKLPLIVKYLDIYDHVFVGGALANDLLRAKGFPVGRSLLSDVELPAALVEHPKLLLPVDVTVESARGQRVCPPAEVGDEESIKDAGPQTVDLLAPFIKEAATILWNGPFGQFEKGYRDITEQVARRVAASNAFSAVGGGDTIAAIDGLSINQQFDWVSTGGGAMLAFLEHGSLPAIDLLRARHE